MLLDSLISLIDRFGGKSLSKKQKSKILIPSALERLLSLMALPPCCFFPRLRGKERHPVVSL